MSEMSTRKLIIPILCILSIVIVVRGAAGSQLTYDLPSSFDLRNVGGVNYVTSVKSQTGGTCWTHGAMASIESNLLMTGAWEAVGEIGEPNLAEYHLDWWNGFNQNNNDDIDPPTGSGLVVHQGGDYRVTSAYLSRGEGAVRDIDGQSYLSPPARSNPSYHYYYVPDIEWYVAGEDLSNIDIIKTKIMTKGVMGTSMCYNESFINGNYTHYQPPTSGLDPNHAIGIVGWDDDKVTQAPAPGAWLCKNSWGTSWGIGGYFWISYYDKHACKHPEMGAISFQGALLQAYDKIYYHDYHGWRDTKVDCVEAFNAFTATGYEYGVELLRAVSFFTAADSVDYIVKIYDRLEDGQLSDELAVKSGTIEYTGFHTITLDNSIEMAAGNDFYVYLYLSAGGHPYDRTSDVPVLLGAKYRTTVESSASPGESYYKSGAEWLDLYEYDSTSNFCIKALSTYSQYLQMEFPDGLPEVIAPAVPSQITVEILDGLESYVPSSGMMHYRFDGGSYLSSPLQSIEGNLYAATIIPGSCEDQPEFYFSAEGDSNTTIYRPFNAPAEVFAAEVGEEIVAFADNFQVYTGWEVENLGATGGDWQRGMPLNDPEWQYDPVSDADGSGKCYLTENLPGDTDVDDGAVRLISPVFDMTAGGKIQYDYYLYLTDTVGAVDRLLVEINSNGGEGTWTEIARHADNNGLLWKHHSITEGEIITAGVTLTSNMKIRFTANDADPQSIVEAGIDGFKVSVIVCELPYTCGDVDNDGLVNILDITYLINYLYKAGPVPPFIQAANVNIDGAVNILDITYLISYLYMGGPEPACD